MFNIVIFAYVINRTIRGMLERYKIINNVNASNIFNTVRKINNLYNNSYHTTLKATPEEILNKKINKNISEKSNKIYSSQFVSSIT